jgi:crotonobetainyl-CoA:carnitine CoA-transferase CaiB-like acyl-CoA transferase
MTDATAGSAETLPLAGLKVIDAATLFAGPLIATLMGDFGADVIKVEHPGRGDSLRGIGWKKNGVPLWWKVVGRNKRSITLDLHHARGQEIFRELCRDADVLIENFRPGRLEAWGIGPETLHQANPGLVVVRTTGFGQWGPYSQRPGFGTLAEAMSGFAHITGEQEGPPTLPPFGLADGVAALTGAFGAMVSLLMRERGEERAGNVVDLSILEPMFSILGPQATEFDQLGIVQQRTGNRIPFASPRNTYQTRDDRWVALSASAESIAHRVFRIIGREDMVNDSRYATNAARLEHADEIDEAIAAWMRRHTLAEVMEAFEAGQGALAPVMTIEDLAADPHMLAREAIIEVEDSELGAVRMQGIVPRLERGHGNVRWAGPPLGAHTDEVLSEQLGLNAAELAELREAGVI